MKSNRTRLAAAAGIALGIGVGLIGPALPVGVTVTVTSPPCSGDVTGPAADFVSRNSRPVSVSSAPLNALSRVCPLGQNSYSVSVG